MATASKLQYNDQQPSQGTNMPNGLNLLAASDAGVMDNGDVPERP